MITSAYLLRGCPEMSSSKSIPLSTGAAKLDAVHSTSVTAARARCRFGRVRGPGRAARGGDHRGWGRTPHGVTLPAASGSPIA